MSAIHPNLILTGHYDAIKKQIKIIEETKTDLLELKKSINLMIDKEISKLERKRQNKLKKLK